MERITLKKQRHHHRRQALRARKANKKKRGPPPGYQRIEGPEELAAALQYRLEHPPDPATYPPVADRPEVEAALELLDWLDHLQSGFHRIAQLMVEHGREEILVPLSTLRAFADQARSAWEHIGRILDHFAVELVKKSGWMTMNELEAGLGIPAHEKVASNRLAQQLNSLLATIIERLKASAGEDGTPSPDKPLN